ncbi:MAG TPA: NADP-dependent oxidoreductase [Nitrososphaeraceae archaeon]|nr:NADP-dependent oxidoreductase [Nitrososphaeraceae archaeon]
MVATRISREICLTEYPVGMPTDNNFKLVQVEIPEPTKEGEFLVRNIWMSVDPYMRGRMRNEEEVVKSFIPSFNLGRPLEGGCIGQVIASKNSQFAVGEYVLGMCGWREYWLSNGSNVMKVDQKIAPIQSFLGTFGMPGLTAYVGLLKIGELKDNDTVFVSAASGAVGSVACQIAKTKGCHVIGSAGSDEKVNWLLDQAGIDYAFNYRKVEDISAELLKVCPDKIDIYFDNVGGKHLEAALDNMKTFGRIVLCGMISQYNSSSPTPGPSNLLLAITNRFKLQGFIVGDHYDMLNEFHVSMAKWVSEGRMKWNETVIEGIENAPKAFISLFKGENFGKMLIKVGPDPAV